MIKRSKKKINIKGFNDSNNIERNALSDHIDELYSIFEKYGEDAFNFLEKSVNNSSEDVMNDEESTLDKHSHKSVFNATASVVNSISRENLDRIFQDEFKKSNKKNHKEDKDKIPSSPLEINPFVFEDRLGLLTFKSFYTSSSTIDLYDMISTPCSYSEEAAVHKLMNSVTDFKKLIHLVEKMILNYTRPACMIPIDEFIAFIDDGLDMRYGIPENISITLFKNEDNDVYFGVNVLNVPEVCECFKNFEEFMDAVYNKNKRIAYSIMYRIIFYHMGCDSSIIIEYNDPENVIDEFYNGRAKEFNHVYKKYVYEYMMDESTGKRADSVDEWIDHHVNDTKIIEISSAESSKEIIMLHNYILSMIEYDEDEDDNDEEDDSDLRNQFAKESNESKHKIEDIRDNLSHYMDLESVDKLNSYYDENETDDNVNEEEVENENTSYADDLYAMNESNSDEDDIENEIDNESLLNELSFVIKNESNSNEEEDDEEVAEDSEEEEDEDEPHGDILTFNMNIPELEHEIEEVSSIDDIDCSNSEDDESEDNTEECASDHPFEDIIITPRRRN